jgi:ABC-2 type transport system ATP-binding protein
MADKEIAVKVQELSKSFRIPLEASNGIKQKLINLLKGRKGYRDFSPLNDISFEIEKGDFFGIVGRNGSGKSTLLKTIAGIYAPNRGLVQVNGALVPFIELGVGFNPELTGRENVFLNGALLGFSREQMETMYDDIVDFAELHDFMEERLKNYSSGMQVRLAFSIAIRAEGDILLLDEVLAVGDEAFQKKCINYFKKLKETKRTVILVTHDMNSVRQFCTKAMLLDGGKIVELGSPKKVSEMYSKLFETVEPNADPITRWGDQAVKIKSVSAQGLSSGVRIEAELVRKEEIVKELVVAYTIKAHDGRALSGSSVKYKVNKGTDLPQTVKVIIDVPCSLSDGRYVLDVSVKSEGVEDYHDVWLDCTTFMMNNNVANPLPLYAQPSLRVVEKD